MVEMAVVFAVNVCPAISFLAKINLFPESGFTGFLDEQDFSVLSYNNTYICLNV